MLHIAACERLLGVWEQTEEAFEELKGIEVAIFETLHELDSLASVVDAIESLAVLESRPKDAIAEIANMIAAAAAIERESYQNLVALVAHFSESSNEFLADLPEAVVLRCLYSHLGQTNYFLLELYKKNVLRGHENHFERLLYKFFCVRGTFRVPNVLTFVYFYPELKAYKRDWAVKEFKSCHTSYRYKKMAHSEQNCITVEPNSWIVERPNYSYLKRECDIDWDEHIRKRENFMGSNEFMKFIIEDKVDEIITGVSGTNFTQEVSYDMYDQISHISLPDTFIKMVVNERSYRREPEEKLVKPKNPTVVQTICRFGKEDCWNALESVSKDTLMTQLSACGHDIVIGGSSTLLQLFAETHPTDINEIIPTAVQYHRNAEFDWLLEQDNVVADFRSVEAAIKYSNYYAFEKLIAAGAHKNNAARPLFNIFGEHNSIEMFRYALIKADAVFDPYACSDTGKTFLHSAAINMGFRIVRFWASKFGNLGFNALDKNSRNPCHYAYTMTTYRKYDHSEEDKMLQLRKPEYLFMAKRTTEDYILETDDDLDL